MIQYVCDRCSAIKNDNNLTRIEFEQYNTYPHQHIKKDICPSCLRELITFLNPLPQEEKK